MKVRTYKFIAMFFLSLTTTYADLPTFDTSSIEKITGLQGKALEEGVFKITVPRTDIEISVDLKQMHPFMGFTSWVSFIKGRQQEMMLMGDLVLFQDEVNPIMDVLFQGGLEVTALHNHFFYDHPKVYFMHIAGEGSLRKTAETIKKVFDKVKEIRNKSKEPGSSFGPPEVSSKNQISPAPLSEIFGQKGQSQEGMFKVIFGRTAQMNCGCQVGKEMGVNTWAAFAGTDENAIVAGDFAVLGEELQGVLKILRKENIYIVAIHHHMIGDLPKFYFLHYWGKGKAKNLAQALRKALDNSHQTEIMKK